MILNHLILIIEMIGESFNNISITSRAYRWSMVLVTYPMRKYVKKARALKLESPRKESVSLASFIKTFL